MLDIQYIRDNKELVAEKAAQKGYPVDVEKLIKTDTKKRSLVTQVEQLRAQRNDLSAQMKGTRPTEGQIEQGKKLKEQIAKIELELQPIEEEFGQLLKSVPNMPLDFVPVGATEDENVIAKTVGEPTKFDFTPRNHWEILEPNDMLDKERAAKIAGSRFAYLKGDLVRLQMAIMQFVMTTLSDEAILQKLIEENDIRDSNGNLISSKPFMPILPPAMLRTAPYVASARLNAEEVTYRAGQPEDDLWLNASAEHTLCTMYWDEILPQDMFPIRYIGYSTSFRREAGTYGKDNEGIIRLHQFDKLEMEVFSLPESGLAEHKLLCAVQEYLVKQINLPYRILQKCTADIGKPNAAGVDVEVWFPGQQEYRETHTADYMTDYQARDLKIRYRRDQELGLVHTNDATAFALGRIMAAIVENFQNAEGKIVIPECLRPFMGGKTVM